MINIDGAYSDEISSIVNHLNQSLGRLQNFIIDSDTQGTVVQSLLEISEIASNACGGLEEIQKKLRTLICEVRSR